MDICMYAMYVMYVCTCILLLPCRQTICFSFLILNGKLVIHTCFLLIAIAPPIFFFSIVPQQSLGNPNSLLFCLSVSLSLYSLTEGFLACNYSSEWYSFWFSYMYWRSSSYLPCFLRSVLILVFLYVLEIIIISALLPRKVGPRNCLPPLILPRFLPELPFRKKID